MNATYILSNGEKLELYLWSDFLEGDNWRNVVEVRKVGEDYSEEKKKKTFVDDTGRIYFLWNKEKVYLDNYIALSVNELISNIKDPNESDGYVFDWTVTATFLKHWDEIGVIIKMQPYDMVVPYLGIACKTSNTDYMNVLCVPFEDRYKKKDCNYKVSFKPYTEDYRKIFGTETFYMSDFTSLLKSGHCELVNLKEYVEKIEIEATKKENKNIKNILNVFKKADLTDTVIV